MDSELVQASVRDGWVRIFYVRKKKKMLIRLLQIVTRLSEVIFPAAVLFIYL